MEEIEKLYDYQNKINEKKYITNVLEWDLNINAPKATKECLIDVKANSSLDVFEMETSREYKKLIDDAINSSSFENLSREERECIKELKRKYELKTKIPKDFYYEYNKLCSMANKVWEDAKKNNDVKMFMPYLDKVVNMTKEYYRYLYPDGNLYDAMLNEYERGMNSQKIDVLFAKLKEKLIPLINKIADKENKSYKKEFSESTLKVCGEYLLNYIGFDLKRGALGVYPHGYTEKLSIDDVRIAFSKIDDPTQFASTIIHEGGHGILEQNMNKKIVTLDNGFLDNLYALHESQSRFFENILGRNINFWIPIYDDVKKILDLDIEVEEFVSILNQVRNSCVRTDADEVTYCLHIILRYEIERDLFNDKLSVFELPDVWNKKMKEYLGIEVTNDSEGILQDVHWSEGLFGYFPSYLLGSIYDGMFLNIIEDNLGNVDEILRKGKIQDITNFLIDNIYKNAGTYISSEIIEKLSGKKVDSKYLIDYFYKKYDK